MCCDSAEDSGQIEDHFDDGTHQTLAECSALCDSNPSCAYFLFGLDQRTGMNRCTTQQRCEQRRSYGQGGNTAIYSRSRGTTGAPCTTPADMNGAVLCDLAFTAALSDSVTLSWVEVRSVAPGFESCWDGQADCYRPYCVHSDRVSLPRDVACDIGTIWAVDRGQLRNSGCRRFRLPSWDHLCR